MKGGIHRSMKAKEVMSKNLITIPAEFRLQDAANLLSEHHIDSVPVVGEKEQLIGFLTKVNLFAAIKKGIPADTLVEQIMEKEVVGINEDEEARQLFDKKEEKFPIVDKNNRLVGILTKTDLLKSYYKKLKNVTTSIQAMLESTNNGIVAIDNFAKITFFNKAAEEILGIKANNALGQLVKDVLPNTNLPYILKTGKKDINKTGIINGRSLLINRTPIILDGELIGAVAIFQDLTDYQTLSQELDNERNTSDILKTILEIAYDGIVVVDHNGYITMLSKEYAKFLKVKPEEVIGKHVADVIENTRMHLVVESGKAEIADLQKINGDYMVATRIPIIKNGEIKGAVGKVLFKNVSDLNTLHKRIKRMEKELERYKGEFKELNEAKYHLDHLIGKSKALQQAKHIAAKAAETDSNVLLLGESGTGKELFAHAIHNLSLRASAPFVKVNCAAIPADLLEAELFGYEEGSFTGAKKGGKKGKFEAADGGTIFLDEIGELPLHMQAKLLRVLQEKEVEKVGATSSKAIDIRIIAATNRNLEEMVQKGEFRMDLYYRLNVIAIQIPALRNRDNDIFILTNYLITKLSTRLNKYVVGISENAKLLLKNYDWPGNVRELENVLERAINMIEDDEIIKPLHLPEKITGKQSHDNIKSLEETLEEAEKKVILDSLSSCKGNKSKAAKLLNISRSTLYEKMNKHKIYN